ncbi:CA14.2 family protein [Megaselia abdita]
MLLKICFVAVVLFVGVESRFGYSRASQRRWGRQHGNCYGKRQSPISISQQKTSHILMPSIEMIGYNNLLPFPLNITNNGHTASVAISKLNAFQESLGDFLPFVKGGKLSGEYEIESLHFHWGDKNNKGAEHVINDMRYTMEMHLVHRNKKYSSLPEALENDDGVAVMGFFFTLGEAESNGLQTLVRHLPQIPNSGDTLSMNVTFSLASLLGSIDTDKFFTYKGSLTTPPCSEAVTWILFPDPIELNFVQIQKFRRLQDNLDDALVDNFRSLQPIGNRRIFYRKVNSFQTDRDFVENSIHHTEIDWFW